MADRRLHVGGRQGRGDPPLTRSTDPFATWREEDEAKDPRWHWLRWFVATALATGAAYLMVRCAQ